MDELKISKMMIQRSGFAALLAGVMSIDCNDNEAVALQLSVVNTLIDVVGQFPVGDEVEMELMKLALEFADRGIAKEDALNEAKSILGGE